MRNLRPRCRTKRFSSRIERANRWLRLAVFNKRDYAAADRYWSPNYIYPGGDPDLFVAELDGQDVVAQSGYQYRQKYIILFRVSDGRISHWREYLNPIPLQEAIASMQ